MPLYEFVCVPCGKRFEKLQKSDDENPSCPACGSSEVKKEISAFSSSTSSAAPCTSVG